MAEYTVLICPVCGKQAVEIHGWDEYGPELYCEHEGDPIEVQAEIPDLEVILALGRFRYAQEQRERDFDVADRAIFRREWKAMTHEERIEKYGVAFLAMHEMMTHTPMLASIGESVEVPVSFADSSAGDTE